MLRVGLTGGLASGKTFVGHALRDLGCYLIEADELGHEVLLPGAEAYDAVIHAFGDEILDQDRHIGISWAKWYSASPSCWPSSAAWFTRR
jgi:dephospho-CoA kinase